MIYITDPNKDDNNNNNNNNKVITRLFTSCQQIVLALLVPSLL